MNSAASLAALVLGVVAGAGGVGGSSASVLAGSDVVLL